jgi:hypothetical protein
MKALQAATMFSSIALALLLILIASSCSPSQATGTDAPVAVTQVVTRLVTQEVTRVVEVPVIATPSPTSTVDASTPDTGELPRASLPDYTDCLYGPASYYVYKTSFPAGQQVEVVGRNRDGSWISIEEVGGWNACWIQASQAQLQNSRVEDLPVINPILPRSEYEFGSPSAIARRDGDVVTVSWQAVFMSVDEVQGYLIDAWVCQDGQHIQLPVFVGTTYEQNNGTISVKITDEAGCEEPSTARIVSVGRRGFAEWEKIFWPAY